MEMKLKHRLANVFLGLSLLGLVIMVLWTGLNYKETVAMADEVVVEAKTTLVETKKLRTAVTDITSEVEETTEVIESLYSPNEEGLSLFDRFAVTGYKMGYKQALLDEEQDWYVYGERVDVYEARVIEFTKSMID